MGHTGTAREARVGALRKVTELYTVAHAAARGTRPRIDVAALRARQVPRHIDAIDRLLDLLPEIFFTEGELHWLGSGRWQVHGYDRIETQPKQIFLRAVCHELGHSFFEPYVAARGLGARMAEVWNVIRGAGALFAKDQGPVVGDAAFRARVQAQALDEFLAEVFMHFLLDGTELRATIDRIQDARVANAWLTVHMTLAEALDTYYDSDRVWRSLLSG